jgi:hypothetical protein
VPRLALTDTAQRALAAPCPKVNEARLARQQSGDAGGGDAVASHAPPACLLPAPTADLCAIERESAVLDEGFELVTQLQAVSTPAP